MNEKDGASCRRVVVGGKGEQFTFFLASVFVGFGWLKWNHGQERKEGTRSGGRSGPLVQVAAARWARSGEKPKNRPASGKRERERPSCDPVTQFAGKSSKGATNLHFQPPATRHCLPVRLPAPPPLRFHLIKRKTKSQLPPNE
jgi:hypothetical protein